MITQKQLLFLIELHKLFEQFPDMRFGQLIQNIHESYGLAEILFFIDDDRFLHWMQRYRDRFDGFTPKSAEWWAKNISDAMGGINIIDTDLDVIVRNIQREAVQKAATRILQSTTSDKEALAAMIRQLF